MSDPGNGNGKKLLAPVLNELMAWGFRAIIAFATAATGFAAEHILASEQEISTAVHQHDTKLELLNERGLEIKENISGVRENVQDHERRIRELENKTRNNFNPLTGH